MKFTPVLKTLTMLSLVTLTLAASSSQADSGYVYFGGNPSPNPWAGAASNANPWLTNPAFQQARYLASIKQRQIEMDQRQEAQMQRILSGMDSGKLTSREAAGLIREHLSIANQERSYLSDGRLGPDELRNLERRLAEAEQHIMFEKRDHEQAGPMGHHGEMNRSGEMNRPSDMGRSVDMGRPGDMGRH
jgi:hypothetical protein